MLAAICYADDVVLVAVSMSAAEVMVKKVIAKLKEVGLTVGAQETHWTSYLEVVDKSIMVDGLAVVWEEVFGVCGIKGVLGRECKTCDRTQICSSQQMSGEVETCSEIFMAPQIVALQHCEDYNVAGFPLEFECLNDGQVSKRQNCKLECEDGGERYCREEAAVDGIGPVVETLAQNWSSVDREGQLERVDCYQRTCAQLGWPCCQKETASLERRRERHMVWSAPTTVENLQVGGHGCWGGLQVCWKRRWSVEN